MLSGKYKALYEQIVRETGKKNIFHDSLHTLAYGTDASFYRLIPKIVIKASNENEVSSIIKKCAEHSIPVTFRAAGTSLSGQAISDSVLLIAGENWRKYSIALDASEITFQPGVTGGMANSFLSPFGKKIGPDPASVNAAMIGGIAANNASGMCCGTAANSYKTVNGIRMVLADGTVLDTRDKESRKSFADTHRKMLSEIGILASDVIENPALTDRIRRKYSIKNTTGYSLNALVDYSDPFDIIEHLMIGSEGTLGFISEITYKTIDVDPFRASALLIFPDIFTACNAVKILKTTKVAAVELVDRTGLRSVEGQDGMPDYLRSLDENACALLIETTALSKDALHENISLVSKSLSGDKTLTGITFTDIPEEYEKLWKIRKGLFPSVGAMRRAGTTVVIEDVAFPLENLAEATTELQSILVKHNYSDAVIFGHALEGNLHFVFAQDFGTEEQVKRYSEMMNDVSVMVTGKYDGSLKAEHGTGRNMAPFVELEWGKDAYSLMKRIKNIFDPLNILNPGVILNSDPSVHLKNLKPVYQSSEITDKCTECGFCESSCVSAGLTLSPRQRIVIHRELSNLKKTGHQPHIAAEIAAKFEYAGNETCATDGLCAIACPVKIDCGKLIKSIRFESALEHQGTAGWIGNNMGRVTSAAAKALNAVHLFHLILGSGLMKGISSGIRKVSLNHIPAWNKYMPKGARRISVLQEKNESSMKVVYFPSCINRSMGVSREYRKERQLSETFIDLIHKAGYEIIFPEKSENLCCGMAFLSKGYIETGKKKSGELEAALLKASDNGRYPVVCDMSPCLYTMKDNIKSMKLFEPVEFILDHLIEHLDIVPLNETITVFPVCSMKKMGIENKLIKLAQMCAKKVIVPETNCCGFAGDRGFTFPELNRHGLRNLKSQIPGEVTYGYSNSRTCEIGLSLNSGVSFKSIVYLVDKVSVPKKAIKA
ncbi:MAG TPA: FAD-binding and (Fe-S)-binding domain-containing protein [Bacteroidales bacterium]|nr:FAD-binding and (Fe-S)-binding domain-containing protein [Bacteroidales bacterium]